jgi:hypothetical protein
MTTPHIGDALRILAELHSGLEDGYWESSSIEMKDLFYDLISAVNMEITELAKLSIQDHHFDYEPVTATFRRARNHLHDLSQQLEARVPRAATASRLNQLLSDTAALFIR